MFKKITVLVFVVFSLFALSACSNLADDQYESGDLALSIADKPVNNVEKVLITIEEVQVKKENDEGWTIINDFEEDGGEKEFDLMTLRFDEELLGQETLEAGFYNQIRLIIAAAEKGTPQESEKSRVVYKDGKEENIFIPSGAQTGLKLTHDFEIREDTITKLLLDFDVSEIMHQAGDMIILPPESIDIIDQIVSGNILGRVVDTDGNHIFEDDVVVEVYNNDDSIADDDPIKSTVASANDEAGSFLIRGLEAGTYKLYAYTAAGDGSQLENALTGTAEDIEVNAEDTTELDKLEDNIVLK